MYNSEILRNFGDHFNEDLRQGKLRSKAWAYLSSEELLEKSSIGYLNIVSFISNFKGYHQHPNFDKVFAEMLKLLHLRFAKIEDTKTIYQLLTDMNSSNPMPLMQFLTNKKFDLACLLLEYLESYFIRMPELRMDFFNRLLHVDPTKTVRFFNWLNSLSQDNLEAFLPVYRILSKALFDDVEIANQLLTQKYPNKKTLIKDIIIYDLLTHCIVANPHILGHLIIARNLDAAVCHLLSIRAILERNPEWASDFRRRLLPGDISVSMFLTYLGSLSEEQYYTFRFGLMKMIVVLFKDGYMDDEFISSFFRQSPYDLFFKNPRVSQTIRHRLLDVYRHGIHAGLILNSYPVSFKEDDGNWSLFKIVGWKKNSNLVLEHYRKFINLILENEMLPKHKVNTLIFANHLSISQLLHEATEITYPYTLTHFFNLLLDLYLVYQVRPNIRESLLLSHAIFKAYASGESEIIRAWSGFYRHFFTDAEFQQMLTNVSLFMRQQLDSLMGAISPIQLSPSPARECVSPYFIEEDAAGGISFFSLRKMEESESSPLSRTSTPVVLNFGPGN